MRRGALVAGRGLGSLGRRWLSSGKAEELVKEETMGRVRLIGLNRPAKRNAVNNAMANRLLDAFERFDSDDSVDSGIVYGEGGVFCAGYDLEEMASAGEEGSELMRRFTEDMGRFRPIGPTRMQPGKPMIAAVSGHAVAGGLELSLVCDLRVVETSAVFGVFCRRVGVPTFNGGTVRLPKIVGLGRALDMILTGREITAKVAYEWGLASRLVQPGTSLGAALQLAQELGKWPQACLRADRASVYHAAFQAKDRDDAFDFEYRNGLPILHKESVEGAQRFTRGFGKHGSFNMHRPADEPKQGRVQPPPTFHNLPKDPPKDQ